MLLVAPHKTAPDENTDNPCERADGYIAIYSRPQGSQAVLVLLTFQGRHIQTLLATSLRIQPMVRTKGLQAGRAGLANTVRNIKAPSPLLNER